MDWGIDLSQSRYLQRTAQHTEKEDTHLYFKQDWNAWFHSLSFERRKAPLHLSQSKPVQSQSLSTYEALSEVNFNISFPSTFGPRKFSSVSKILYVLFISSMWANCLSDFTLFNLLISYEFIIMWEPW